MSARAAFGYPSFRNYMIARFLATVSNEMQAVAVGWQIYSMTHRPLDLGLVGLAQFLPGVLLFLVAGHAADRFPRRGILRACYAVFGLCSLALAGFTLGGFTSVHPIYFILLANGAVRAFHHPTSQAFLPLLVAEEHFVNAVTWSASVFTTATIFGPMIGGLVYGLSGSPLPVYLGAAASYGVGFVLLLRVRTQRPQQAAPVQSAASIAGGLRFLGRNRLVLGAMSLDMFAVLLGGAVALLPIYAREILVIGATGLGLLRCAPGVGATLMAVTLAHRPLGRRAGVGMLIAVAGFGAATVVFGLSRNVWLSLAALMLVGGCDMVSIIVRQTIIQLGAPDEMRGRVSAVNSVFVGASNEVGQFESGVTAQWFGAVPAVVLGGLGTIAVVALWSVVFPSLRRWRGASK
ncbi:MAG: MFS transporter [Bryobacteraceae bacterium]